MDNLEGAGAAPPVVSLAFGWRAREVERRSTAPVRFNDRDIGVIIVEGDPVALAYAEPGRAFVLPVGRYLRADQAAGRVFSATATPHLEALSVPAATALADTIARLLDGAGWTRVPGAGIGAAAAVREAAQFAASGQDGSSEPTVGEWRVPRSPAPWAALPPGTRRLPGFWDGVSAVVSVRSLRGAASPEAARLILQVRMEDDLLSSALQEIANVRRSRHGGEMQTLSGWDKQPSEPAGVAP